MVAVLVSCQLFPVISRHVFCHLHFFRRPTQRKPCMLATFQILSIKREQANLEAKTLCSAQLPSYSSNLPPDCWHFCDLSSFSSSNDSLFSPQEPLRLQKRLGSTSKQWSNIPGQMPEVHFCCSGVQSEHSACPSMVPPENIIAVDSKKTEPLKQTSK